MSEVPAARAALTRRAALTAGLLALAAGCSSGSTTARRADPAGGAPTPTPSPTPTASSPSSPAAVPPADAATGAARATVPVLCWHQLRDWAPADGTYARQLLICPPAAFRAQLDAVAGAGYTTIGPEQYLAHLTTGAALPAKPILLSFDDSQGTQVSEGLPQLVSRSMTGTFFAMTVVLGKSGWMSEDDLRRLDAAGMTVAAHTWDHHRADRYAGTDWQVQLEQPRALLEQVLRHPVEHFAYPYGAWAPADFPHLAAAGYRTAFQLADRTPSADMPLFTLRRQLVDSRWTGADLLAQLERPAR